MIVGGPQIGAVVAGKYRVERVLGRGGMGIVVRAMHLQLHQPVAIKFLVPEVLQNQQVVQRFLREAQAAVRLRSEHVARVIDVGTLESDEPYMVLEYLDGTDLSSFPRSQLTTGGVIDLVLQACEALAEAHSLGIVHRDIKPANFFITRSTDGTPLLKILDFGISKAPAAAGQLTATHVVMGTPAYMSPEQMRSSRNVDHRSDIWSMGVVLYELLQGGPPFEADTFSSMVLKVVNAPLPKLTVQLPGNLDTIIYRCLEKDPARRFQNIAELAQAIAKYARSETQAAISVQRTSGILGTQPGRATEPTREPPAIARAPDSIATALGSRLIARRWPIIAATSVLTIAVTLAIAALGTRQPVEARSPDPRPENPAGSQPVSGPTTVRTPPPADPEPPIARTHPGSPASTAAAPAPVQPGPTAQPPRKVAKAPASPPRSARAKRTTPALDVRSAAKPEESLDKPAARPAEAPATSPPVAPAVKPAAPTDDEVLDPRN